MNLKPGVTLHGGSYRIIETLGRGGFGITYLAEQVMAERKVCIKEFFPEEYYNRDANGCSISLGSQGSAKIMETFKAKFIKEAKTIAKFDHSNIIHIHDVFEENNTAYYVMEYIDGESLSAVVKRRGALDEAAAVSYIRQVADALGYIHEQRIMHLDVKPGNVMLRSRDDRAILIDFGLSKHYNAENGEATSSSPVGVSHGFAPMEQYKSDGVKEFSPATDIYSLGATLYYLVTGLVPPEAADISDEGLPALPAHLSQGVRTAIERSMADKRKARPQSIAEFLALLEDNTPEVVAPVAEATIIDVEPKQTTPQPKNEPKPKKSKRGLWLGIFLFILAAVASFILFGGGSSKKEKLKPELILESDSEVILPYDGGSGEIKYTITNPVDGESVKCATDAKWLTLNHNDGVVSCTAQTNTTGKDRNAIVTLTYCGQSVEVNIYQYLLPFDEIWYTSSDGKVVKPYKEGKDIFGAEIESNTYKNGKGIIKFKGDVTTIGEKAFYKCKSLTSVTIPNSVTTIGDHAFWNCSSLTSITIPNSVTTIGVSAFECCRSLSSVTIPNSVTRIGSYAFCGCDNLTSVTIPDSVTTIGRWAFGRCESLTSITIPNSVTTIGDGAFCNCGSLKEFKGKYAADGGRCLIKDNIIIAYANASGSTYAIPNSVTTIGYGAFDGCSNLKSVTIPNNVTTIGWAAFCGCDNLRVTIPSSVTTIEVAAFYECDNLSEETKNKIESKTIAFCGD